MVRTLRNKFIVVTVALFAVFFSLIIAETTFFNTVAYYQDTYQELSWLIDNKPFEHVIDDETDKLAFDMVYYGYNPIFCLLIDSKGTVLDSHVIGSDTSLRLEQQVIDSITTAKKNSWKYRSYVFCRKTIGNKTIILITDCKSNYSADWLANRIIASFAGLFIITVIAFILSRFITGPAQEALTREKQLNADIGHELKTPLTSIKVNLDALSQSGVSSPLLDNTKEAVDKMGTLIQEMLTLSTVESGKDQLNFSEFLLSNAVERIALTYESISFLKGVSFDYNIKDNIYFNGDRNKIEKLLEILLDNALKYSTSGGRIELTLDQTQQHIEITVSDTGVGISKTDLPHIYERFYVADRSRSSDSFGLGLSIAKAIVDNHRGKILVESKEGQGTTFKIRFNSNLLVQCRNSVRL